MRNVPKDLKFSRSHEWIRLENDGTFSVGISDHAQGLLGDLVYVELPVVGQEYGNGQECCVVESVKAASDVYCPVSGTVVAVNSDLESAPEEINLNPYDNGWLFKLEVNDVSELEELMDAEEYENMIAQEA